MTQPTNIDDELQDRVLEILDDYQNMELNARYNNIDWAEHAIMQLIQADRKKHTKTLELTIAAERAKVSQLQVLLDAEKSVRKKHKLDARIDELAKMSHINLVASSVVPRTSTDNRNPVRRMNDHIAERASELKAERDKL